jgi:hypothetical protein
MLKMTEITWNVMQCPDITGYFQVIQFISLYPMYVMTGSICIVSVSKRELERES